jgi:hypothetical protein
LFTRSLLFALAAFVLIAPAAAATTCEEEFTFNPRPALALSDVKRLAKPGTMGGSDLQTADGAQLVVWPFDEEDRPSVGPRRALALVYVTRGDLGEKAVGGELLQLRSKPPFNLDHSEIKRSADGLQLALPAAIGCPPYVIRLDGHGLLLVQGRPLGRLR